ncbi:MAG: hypothetical protein ACI4OS_03145 [Akkermansia sp.]
MIAFLFVAAGLLSTASALTLPKAKVNKPAVTVDAEGVKVSKPSVSCEGKSCAEQIAEKKSAYDAAKAERQAEIDAKIAEKKSAYDAAKAEKQAEIDAKVAEAKEAKAAAEQKIQDAKDAAAAAKEGATKPELEVTKPAATLDAEGLKITKPSVKLK